MNRLPQSAFQQETPTEAAQRARDERIFAMVEEFRQDCRDKKLIIYPGSFVDEETAAILLSKSLRTVQDWRYAGIGPTPHRLGPGRKKWGYTLRNLAIFVEDRRKDFSV